MRKRRYIPFLLVAVFLQVNLDTTLFGVEQPTARQIKKTLRLAKKAADETRLKKALELYRQVLAATSPGDSRRREALYFEVMASLASVDSDPGWERTHRVLSELEIMEPLYTRRAELQAVRILLRSLTERRHEIDDLEEALAQKATECEEVQLVVKEDNDKVDNRVKALERQLRRTQGQLSKTQKELLAREAELEIKEEALKKLKDALVED